MPQIQLKLKSLTVANTNKKLSRQRKFLEILKTRRPATTGVFSPQFCWRCLLKRWKRFFKKYSFLIYFLIFHIKKFPDFSPKNFTIKVEKTFLRNDTIWYAFYINFPIFQYFEKYHEVFLNPPPILFFSQENPNFVRFEKSYYFNRILRQIC